MVGCMQRRVRLASPRAIVAAAGSVGCILIAGWASEACRDPTQVTVDIRTLGIPCSSLKRVKIVVARAPTDAEDRMALGSLSAEVARGQCDGERVGTLVLTPSEAKGAIIVAARVSDDAAATCKPPDYKGCIVARRSFTFLDHVSVTLPMTLEVACADVPCDVVSSCRSGTCVSSEASCSESSQRCELPAEPVVLADGGVEPLDAARDGAFNDGSVALDGAAGDGSADAGDGSVGSPDGATNQCPLQNGTKPDCTTLGASALCCAPTSGAFCVASAAACADTDPRYACLGAAHCAGATWCCTTGDVAPPQSACAPICKAGAFLCMVDTDCPPGQACNTPGPLIGGSPHPICGK